MKILLTEGALSQLEKAESIYQGVQNHLNGLWADYNGEIPKTTDFIHHLHSHGVHINTDDNDIIVDLTKENSGIDTELVFSKDFPNNATTGGKIILNVDFMSWSDFLRDIPVLFRLQKDNFIRKVISINNSANPKTPEETQLLDSLFLDSLRHFRDIIHSEYQQKLDSTPTDPQRLRKAIYSLRSVDGFAHDIMGKVEFEYGRAMGGDAPLSHDVRQKYMGRIHSIYNKLIENLTV